MAVGMSNPAQMQAMGQQAPWENPNNYKKCVKKQYEIWVCKPFDDTIVVNKLEQASVLRHINGETAFTAYEEHLTRVYHTPRHDFLATLTDFVEAGLAYQVQSDKNDPTFVLSGTRGELWCIKLSKLAKKYVWASDGAPITPATLKARMLSVDGQDVMH